MVLEAAIREQRLDSMRESSGTLPSTGVFVPFGDVVKRFSWTPDASMEARRGIGSVDALSHDTGLESHSLEVSYLLENPMVVAATMDSGLVADADQIKFTAVKGGHDGNSITVALLDGTADAGGISVVGNAITVEVGTATTDDLVTLMLADTDLVALVTPATLASNIGSVVQAFAVGTLEAGVSTPLSEAFNRDDDGQLESRTIVLREKHYEGGTSSNGLRTYTVAEGCKPASARIPGNPEQAGPIEVGITYTAEKVRHYEISQPSTACVLYVLSSEAADYLATITAEDDESNIEEIVVSGTGSVVFPYIDAIELASELTGTLTVLQGATTGATLAVVHGSLKYANAEGDLGVPVIPASGSRTTALSGTMEKFLGDTITHGSGGTFAYDINSVELSVDNSIETLPRNNSRKRRVIEGNRVLQMTATVLGEAEYQRQITRHLQTDESNIVWTLTNTTLTLSGAAMISAPDKTVEEGGAYMQLNTTFEGTAITIA